MRLLITRTSPEPFRGLAGGTLLRLKPASLQIERKQEPITMEFPSPTYDVYTLGYF